MPVFKSARGHEFRITKKDSYCIVSWSDPATGSWQPRFDNEAGDMFLPIQVSDDLPWVEEGDKIRIGDRIELLYCGLPFIYGLNVIGVKCE